MRWGRAAVVALALAGTAGACGDDGGGGASATDEAFCEAVAQDAPDLLEGPDAMTTDPGIVGELRSLREDAPDELRDDFEVLTEANDDEEIDAALQEIQAYVAAECGIDTSG